MNGTGAKLDTARMVAVTKLPYLASVLLRLPVRVAPVETAQITPSGRILVSERFVANLSVQELAFVLAHEALHWTLDHFSRGRNRSPFRVWNVAADLEINPALTRAGLQSPDRAVFRPVFPHDFRMEDGLAAEEYFGRLQSMAQQAMAQAPADLSEDGDENTPQNGKSSRSQGSQSEHPGSGNATSDQDEPGAGSGDAQNQDGDQPGSGSGSNPGADQKQPQGGQATSTQADQGEDGGLTPEEAEALRRAVLQRAREYASHNPGHVPGEMLRQWERVFAPKLPWNSILRTLVSRLVDRVAGGDDADYNRPPRRVLPSGVIIPRRSEPAPTICAIVDTSASISQDVLERMVSEVLGICSEVGQVRLLWADTRVYDAGVVYGRAQVKTPKGGGGTEMDTAIEWAQRHVREADLLICFTDGFTAWPANPPRIPLVVVLAGPDRASRDTVPRYARAVLEAE